MPKIVHIKIVKDENGNDAIWTDASATSCLFMFHVNKISDNLTDEEAWDLMLSEKQTEDEHKVAIEIKEFLDKHNIISEWTEEGKFIYKDKKVNENA